jgi:hypothetical protein
LPSSFGASGEEIPGSQKRKATAFDQQPYINYPYLDYIFFTEHGQALFRALADRIDSAQKKQKVDCLSSDDAYVLSCEISPNMEETAE